MSSKKRPASASSVAKPLNSTKSAKLVPVKASGIGGHTIEFLVHSSTCIQSIKKKIAEKWNLPASCQKLVIGEKLAFDSDRISKYNVYNSSGDKCVSLSIVLSLEDVCGCLKQRYVGSMHCWSTVLADDGKLRDMKLQALTDLGRLGQQGGEQSVKAVVGCLIFDQCQKVRKSALSTLSLVAGSANPCARDELLTMFGTEGSEWEDWEVFAALKNMSAGEDAIMIDALIKRLELSTDTTECKTMRYRAMKLLGFLAVDSCATVVSLVSVAICHPDSDVRSRASMALFQAVRKIGYLDYDEGGKILSAVGHGIIPVPTADRIVDSVLPYLENSAVIVQHNALVLILDMVRVILAKARRNLHADLPFKDVLQSDGMYFKLVTLVTDCAFEVDDRLNMLALETLREIAVRGDGKLSAKLSPLLANANTPGDANIVVDLQEAVLKVLAVCTKQGDEQVVNTVSVFLNSKHKEVRTAAMSVLNKIVDH